LEGPVSFDERDDCSTAEARFVVSDHQVEERFARFLGVGFRGNATPLSKPLGFRLSLKVEQPGKSLKVIFSRNGSRSRKGRAVRPEL
jgi:hypothetical protein